MHDRNVCISVRRCLPCFEIRMFSNTKCSALWQFFYFFFDLFRRDDEASVAPDLDSHPEESMGPHPPPPIKRQHYSKRQYIKFSLRQAIRKTLVPVLGCTSEWRAAKERWLKSALVKANPLSNQRLKLKTNEQKPKPSSSSQVLPKPLKSRLPILETSNP